jgi:hypothetical protein
MANAELIGIVTVTYNGEEVLQEFFDSLAAQTHRTFILYVVDNASQDQTLQMSKQRADLNIVVISNAVNLGVAEGNNQGIQAALADGCECVLLLNNDTVFPPDLVAQLYSGLDQHHCDMTTAKMYYHDHPTRIWCAGGRFRTWLGYQPRHTGIDQEDVGQYDVPRRVTYVPTCCLLVRASVFDRVGLMDSRYFVYFDDVDFLYRCMKGEVSLWYLPEAKLWHKVASSTKIGSTFCLHYGSRNRAYFIAKYCAGLQVFMLNRLYRTYFRLGCLIARDSREAYRTRLAAWIEGERM